MQTFLAYPDYRDSMTVLDPKRLGNQVYREGITLIRGGWPNHPASKMWRGHHYHLALYLMAGLDELAYRGKLYLECRQELYDFLNHLPDTGPPSWLGDPAFHASHRSNLLRKDPVWYGKFGWAEAHDLPYIWPIPSTLVPPVTVERLKKGKLCQTKIVK